MVTQVQESHKILKCKNPYSWLRVGRYGKSFSKLALILFQIHCRSIFPFPSPLLKSVVAQKDLKISEKDWLKDTSKLKSSKKPKACRKQMKCQKVEMERM